jgi:predicted secreted protein
MERPQDRVVVECGGEDMATIPAGREESLDEDVQRIGRVLGEDHVLRQLCAKEARERFPGERDVVLALAAGGPP